MDQTCDAVKSTAPQEMWGETIEKLEELEQHPEALDVQSIGRPKALDQPKMELAQRMHASGESAATIATTLGVSRATVYRVLAEQGDTEE